MDKYTSDKFIALLNNLSDTDLRELGSLFAQPDVCETLVNIINATLKLRQSERKSKYEIYDKSKMEERQRASTELKKKVAAKSNLEGIMESDGIKTRFFSLLEDKKLFPSIRDVVESINREFNCGIQHKYYSKHGRNAIINKCWGHLRKYSEREQRKMIKSFVDRMLATRSQKDEYRELFKILANHE